MNLLNRIPTFFIILFFVILIIYSVPKIRERRLKLLAKKYNLSFIPKLEIKHTDAIETKRNLLVGNLNNKNIEIYDKRFIGGSGYGNSGPSNKSWTILEVNNKKIKLKSFLGVAYVTTIGNHLSKLSA